MGAGNDQDLPVSVAFHLASLKRGWKAGSKRWNRAWNACMKAEFDQLIGTDNNNLEGWRRLCVKVGIKGALPSITQCKKMILHARPSEKSLVPTPTGPG